MKIDLHVHTSLNSACSPAPPEQQIRGAIARRLDGIVIADHGVILSEAERDALQSRFPDIRLFRGAELNVGSEHVTFVGGPSGKYEWLSSEAACDLARDSNALTIWTHPYLRDEPGFALDVFTPDAIELASMNVNNAAHDAMLEIAARYRMKPVGSSDDHDTKYVGLFYIEMDCAVDNEEELTSEVRAGRYRIGADLEALEWRFREMIPLVLLAEEIARAGGTVEDYRARGGLYDDVFKRIADGRGYLPNLQAIGLRGDDLFIRTTGGT